MLLWLPGMLWQLGWAVLWADLLRPGSAQFRELRCALGALPLPSLPLPGRLESGQAPNRASASRLLRRLRHVALSDVDAATLCFPFYVLHEVTDAGRERRLPLVVLAPSPLLAERDVGGHSPLHWSTYILLLVDLCSLQGLVPPWSWCILEFTYFTANQVSPWYPPSYLLPFTIYTIALIFLHLGH